ncbi:MAG: hypothetical protein SGJ11_06790, partial [Phycisphaerae bacterium]|nr:hypothetical protein [Phycisphaerae bacterium]
MRCASDFSAGFSSGRSTTLPSVWGAGALIGSLALSILAASAANAQNLGDRLHAVAEQRRVAASQDTSKASLFGALVYTDITCDFKDTHAKDAIEYIANALGVSIVARYTSDRAGTGIDPEAEVTLKADGKPALTVLEMVLSQVSLDEPCTWQLRDGFIEVGTKERLSAPSARELRMYPVRDILFESPRFDNAPIFNLSDSIQQANGNGGG